MKRWLAISVTTALFAFFVYSMIPTIASNITNANYYGVLTISNDNVTATNVATIVDNTTPTTGRLDTADLITSGFLANNATNCAIQNTSGADVPFMPGWGANPWVLWVPSIVQNGYLSNLFYCDDATGGSIRYFPGAGGMTCLDSPTTELGNNFSITASAYYDTETGTSENVLLKTAAFRICTSDVVDNALAAYIPTYTADITVDNAGVATHNILGANWEAQTFTATSTTLISRVTLFMDSTVGDSTIIARLRATAAGAPTGPDLAISPATTVTGGGVGATTITFNCPYRITNAGVYAIVISGTAAPATPVALYNNANPYAGGQRYDSADSGATWTPQAGDDFRCETFRSLGVMANTGVTVNEHDVVVSADTVNMILDIDGGADEDTRALGGGGVPNNANNWTWFPNAVTPYVESLALNQGVLPRQRITWNYAATFTDSTGNGNNATPTFRTTTSDADVIATLTSFGPTSESKAPPYSVSNVTPWIPDNVTISGNFTINMTPTFPGASVITALANASATPAQLPFTIIGGFIIIVASVSMSRFLRMHGSGSLIVKIAVIGCLMGLFYAVHWFDFFMLIFFVIISAAIAMGSRKMAW